jgi:hypothetical protein
MTACSKTDTAQETDAQKAKRILLNDGDLWTYKDLGFDSMEDLAMQREFTLSYTGSKYYKGLEIVYNELHI